MSKSKMSDVKLRRGTKKGVKTVSAKIAESTTPIKQSRIEDCFAGHSDDFCPICQMPFRILVVQTRNWHLSECMEVDRTKQKECPVSVDCDSTIVSHYMKMTHFGLAMRLSGIDNPSNYFTENQPPPTYAYSQESSHHPESVTDPCDSKLALKGPDESKDTTINTQERLLWKLSSEEGGSIPGPVNGTRSPPCTTSSGRLPFKSPLRQPWSKKPRTDQPTIASMFGFPEKPVVKPSAPSSVSSDSGSYFGKRSQDSSSAPSLFDGIGRVVGRGVDDGGQVANKRRCPQYKKLPDVPFTVDAFRYGEIPNITAYFLSHFHYDHYEGLTTKFQGELYCSQVTANLVKLKLRVKDVFIRPLPMDAPRVVRGVEVSLIDANHCPGSVMFVFRYCDGRTVLHTGDFRADAQMLVNSCLKPLRVDYLYLDTTYCQPIYDFPTQKEVLDFVVTLAKRQMTVNPKTLFVCGSYTVGKEKVFLAIAQALNMRIFAKTDKRRILECLDDKPLHRLLTTDDRAAQIHVLRMSDLNYKILSGYLATYNPQFTHIMALKPTGWEFNSKSAQRGATDRPSVDKCSKFTCRDNVTIYGIPYSEHSSFGELRDFVRAVNPGKIIPTVNVSGHRAQVQSEILAGWTSGQRGSSNMFQSTINDLLKKPKLAL